MARRKDHNREELKALIVDKAWDIVEKEGFLSLSARGLAKEIGYSQGTIYNVFDSMEALNLELNSITLNILYEALSAEGLYKQDKELIDNLKKMASVYQKFVKQNRNHWLMLFSHNPAEEITEEYQKRVDKLFLPLEELLKGLVKNNRKVKIMARTLWASVHGIVLLNNSGRLHVVSAGKEAKIMTDLLIENFVRGVE